MAFLVSSVANGIGSGCLSLFTRGSLGQTILRGGVSPSFSAAVMFGTACSLVNRSIDVIAANTSDKCNFGEKENILLAVGVIALKMFSAYEVANQLMFRLDVCVPDSYIHFENVLFFASILEMDFDLTVKDVSNGRVWSHVSDQRYHTWVWNVAREVYHQIPSQN